MNNIAIDTRIHILLKTLHPMEWKDKKLLLKNAFNKNESLSEVNADISKTFLFCSFKHFLFTYYFVPIQNHQINQFVPNSLKYQINFLYHNQKPSCVILYTLLLDFQIDNDCLHIIRRLCYNKPLHFWQAAKTTQRWIAMLWTV